MSNERNGVPSREDSPEQKADKGSLRCERNVRGASRQPENLRENGSKSTGRSDRATRKENPRDTESVTAPEHEPTRWEREKALKSGSTDSIPPVSPRAQKIKDIASERTPERLKNPSDLQVRFRTGAVYVLISFAGILINNVTMLLLVVVTAAICTGEFFYMLRSDAKLPNELLGIVGAVCYPLSMFFFGLEGALYTSFVLMFALIVWYVFYQPARVQDVSVSLFGAMYCGLLLCGLLVIRMALPKPWGGIFMLLLFCSVWANDGFAYLVGRKLGKHKLAPHISPKKSWEGFIAGLFGSALMWVVMSFVPGVTMDIVQAIVFGLVCGAAGVLGDLAESRIKRNSGFKDSGSIMPGHGGLLDRCDSLFTVSIVASILLFGFGCLPLPTTFLW